MKKILCFAIIVLSISACMGRVPSAYLTDAIYAWELDTIFRTSRNSDTIAGTSDSMIVVNNWVPEPGWEYVLINDSTSGTGRDSTELIINIDCLDDKGNLIYRVLNSDTIMNVTDDTTRNSEANVLGVGQTAVGSKYKITLDAGARNGGQVIIHHLWCYRRKPILRNDVWKR